MRHARNVGRVTASILRSRHGAAIIALALFAATAMPTAVAQEQPAAAEQDSSWGDLTGRFVYDGAPPTPQKWKISGGDADYLRRINAEMVDESLVVDRADGGIANVVIYLMPEPGKKLDIHPHYAETAEAEVRIEALAGRFNPHIQLLRTSQTLVQANRDSIGYNFNIAVLRNPRNSVLIPTGPTQKVQFAREERLPCPVTCNIHPWMNAYLLIRHSPYMAKTDANGRFTIKRLPVGTHRFQLWHERGGYLRNLQVNERVADQLGQIEVEVKPGGSSIGEQIKLSPLRFHRAAARKQFALETVLQRCNIVVELPKQPFQHDRRHGAITGVPAFREDLQSYRILLAAELGRYPIEYVRAVGLKKIVLCTILTFDGQRRSAIPDFETDTLYLDVSPKRRSREYLRRVFHHEFFHLVDYRDDGKVYEDEAWAALNREDFQYGKGGKTVQNDSTVSAITDKFPGFLNRYSTAGVEEDKAEIYAYLMVQPAVIDERSKLDPILHRKQQLLRQQLMHFSQAAGEMLRPLPVDSAHRADQDRPE